MKLTRTVAALAFLLAAACGRPPPSAVGTVPVRITVPPPGRPLSETYPPPSRPTEPVRLAVFDRINRDRVDTGLPEVAWDEAAARVADAFCTAQIAERTRGHFLRDGVPPYARTGEAGVFGYQAENAASWSTTATEFADTPLALALSAQRSMMEERPPRDGHRRTILDPDATHVGVGWAMRGGRFQLAEEFQSRRLERLTLRTQTDPAMLRVSGAARSPTTLRFVTIAREPLPAGLTREEANARTTYSYAAPFEAFVEEGHISLRAVGLVTRDRIRMGPDRDFSFLFAPERPGLFTFVFWFVAGGEDQARPGGSATIRVES